MRKNRQRRQDISSCFSFRVQAYNERPAKRDIAVVEKNKGIEWGKSCVAEGTVKRRDTHLSAAN